LARGLNDAIMVPMPTPIDHDQIFKGLIEAFFREFMELFCPGEAQVMDFGRVEFLREEHFTDVQAGTRRRLDLVAARWTIIAGSGCG